MFQTRPSNEEIQVYLSQALYQQATGLTQSALDTVNNKITSLEGLEPADLRNIAAIQLQGCDYAAVNRTLEGQEDLMSLFLRGKADFGLGHFQQANALFSQCKQQMLAGDGEASLRPELENQITLWTNKSQIELSSARQPSNQAAYLSTASPQNPAMFTATKETAGEESKTAPTSS